MTPNTVRGLCAICSTVVAKGAGQAVQQTAAPTACRSPRVPADLSGRPVIEIRCMSHP